MGLYDDEGPITKGPLADPDYVASAVDFEQLDDAMSRRQPEAVIMGFYEGLKARLLERTVPKFPEHETVKKWKALVEKLDSKLNKNPPSAAPTPVFKGDWGLSDANSLRHLNHSAKGYANEGKWGDAGKYAEYYTQTYTTISDPNNSKTVAKWYRDDISAEWKKKFETWNAEMVAIMAEAKTK